jgi:hypothetical protein
MSRLGSRSLFGAVFVLAVMSAFTPRSAGAPGTRSGDPGLRGAVARLLPPLEAAARVADGGRGGPDAVQAQYDLARDFEGALVASAPVSEGCQRLHRTATRYAHGRVTESEGVDRLSPALVMAGAKRAQAALTELKLLSRSCSFGPLRPVSSPPELLAPRSNEIFLGEVTGRAPAGTTGAVLIANGRVVSESRAKRGSFTTSLDAAPGRYSLKIRFLANGRELGTAVSRDVWLLPPSAVARGTKSTRDRQQASKLASVANRFSGQSGIWLQKLGTGAYAGWNEDARFPAASTVKLAVLIAALDRFGPRPERSRVAYDLRTLAAWSSNLAANRLVDELGGSEVAGSRIAQAVLRRLGANSSTYTGDYRVGTSLGAGPTANAPDPPPLVSQRVTTARDLGRILEQLHGAAFGDRAARKSTGLSRHEAQVGLTLLLASQPTRDNLGLFRPTLGRAFPMAQKNGWLRDARHTAAVLYATDGPRIAVVLTYRSGLARADAEKLGGLVAQAALGRR